MLRFLELLAATIALRPYVFVFFGCYLVLAFARLGYARTIVFTVVAFLIAWVSEWSSAVAGYGIPFGAYTYVRPPVDRELWIAGVPFMDSLSFTFLSYVSWDLAISLRGDRDSIRTTIVASILMTFLDVIIDPVALRGDRWFLGQLYFYPAGGLYFGVTLLNFAGWFAVSFLIIRTYLVMEKLILGKPARIREELLLPIRTLVVRYGALILYFGILAFNLFITFWIDEVVLGLTGLALTSIVGILLVAGIKSNGSGIRRRGLSRAGIVR